MGPEDSPPYIPVLDDSALPEGGLETVEVRGLKILLVRRNGKVHALDNTCPHLGGSLGRGTLQGGAVVCPLHHWTFDLSTGRASGIPDEKVPVYEVLVEGGKIGVRIPS